MKWAGIILAPKALVQPKYVEVCIQGLWLSLSPILYSLKAPVEACVHEDTMGRCISLVVICGSSGDTKKLNFV